ncbi:hypothetical protein V8D89_009475 [Ganoderma adspersum]
MKYFVAFLVILDMASLVLAIDALYVSVVAALEASRPSYRLPLVLVRIVFGLYELSIFEVSRRNKKLAGSIITLSLAALGTYIHSDAIPVSSPETRALAGVANSLNVVCDIVITAALSYYHSRRTGFTRTDSIINRLILYAVNCGALTAICQACLTVTTAESHSQDVTFPGHAFHLPFDLLTGKSSVYCNTLLATLNARMAMREDGDNVMEVGTLILNRINESIAGSRKSRGAPSDEPLEHRFERTWSDSKLAVMSAGGVSPKISLSELVYYPEVECRASERLSLAFWSGGRVQASGTGGKSGSGSTYTTSYYRAAHPKSFNISYIIRKHQAENDVLQVVGRWSPPSEIDFGTRVDGLTCWNWWWENTGWRTSGGQWWELGVEHVKMTYEGDGGHSIGVSGGGNRDHSSGRRSHRFFAISITVYNADQSTYEKLCKLVEATMTSPSQKLALIVTLLSGTPGLTLRVLYTAYKYRLTFVAVRLMLPEGYRNYTNASQFRIL